jgi:hypothetical protein
MTWTYSGNPGDSLLDELRFWTQDTNPDEQLLSDEEYAYLSKIWMDRTGSVLYTASVACDAIAAKFTGEVDVSGDAVSVPMGQLMDRYIRLAALLRDRYKAEAATMVAPILTGIMWDETFDASIKPLRFGVGMFDNYEAGRQDYGDYDPGNRPWWEAGGDVPGYLRVGE